MYRAYKEWAQVKGQPVKYNYCGEMKSVMKPTFAENLKFFFSYQLNFMYWRYSCGTSPAVRTTSREMERC